MNKPVLKLCSLALALTGALSAVTAMAQTYRVLPVQRETSLPNTYILCQHINYQGTVMCKESIIDPKTQESQERFIFDNPFNRPASGRSLPSVVLPPNQSAVIQGFNSSGMIAGFVDPDSRFNGAEHRSEIMVAANGARLSIQNPFGSGYSVEAKAINEQGWLLLGSMSLRELDVNAYLRIPNATDFTQGSYLPISCSPNALTGSRLDAAYPSKININGLLGGTCGTKPVVWGWWDLATSYDLTAALPSMIDLGFGPEPRTDASFESCRVADMADRADVVLVECNKYDSRRPGQNIITQFVNTPPDASGAFVFQQLPRSISASGMIYWRAVNEQGCAVGTAINGLYHGVVKCPDSSHLTFLTFANNEGYFVREALDINASGDILVDGYNRASGNSGYMVFTTRR